MAYQGINFRATAGYRTDDAGQTYSLGEAYPVTRGGITFGWNASIAADTRDRSTTNDPRLGGTIFTNHTTQRTLRIDLASTGLATIRLAIGDAGGGVTNYIQLLDNGVPFATIGPTATAGARFLDATGVEYSEAGWVANNTAITHTFTSTLFTIKMGDGVSSGLSELAHVSVDIAAADTTAPILSSPTGAATGNTTASATVSTDEGAGTIWCLTNTSATATASAVKAGTSQAVTATGVQTFASRTGLTADTLYYNHFVQDDAAGTPNTSTVANSASFRTTGAVTFSGPVPTRNGVVGAAASFANASFFASAFTLAYTLQAGTLPAGLTLSSSTGIISGTPTTAGTSSGIVIRATDTNSNAADTNSYSIVIAATNAAPTFPGTISNISGTAGSAITPVNVSGQFSDTDALTYTASPAGTAWPSALVVNPSTGIISGTVAGAGTTTGLKVRATDTASQTVDSNAFNAVIAAAPANPTVTLPVALCHAMGGLPLISEPGKVQFLSKTNLTAAPLANVSKTTNADGTLTPWAQAGLTASVPVTLRWISDADGHEGYYDVTPA